MVRRRTGSGHARAGSALRRSIPAACTRFSAQRRADIHHAVEFGPTGQVKLSPAASACRMSLMNADTRPDGARGRATMSRQPQRTCIQHLASAEVRQQDLAGELVGAVGDRRAQRRRRRDELRQRSPVHRDRAGIDNHRRSLTPRGHPGERLEEPECRVQVDALAGIVVRLGGAARDGRQMEGHIGREVRDRRPHRVAAEIARDGLYPVGQVIQVPVGHCQRLDGSTRDHPLLPQDTYQHRTDVAAGARDEYLHFIKSRRSRRRASSRPKHRGSCAESRRW